MWISFSWIFFFFQVVILQIGSQVRARQSPQMDNTPDRFVLWCDEDNVCLSAVVDGIIINKFEFILFIYGLWFCCVFFLLFFELIFLFLGQVWNWWTWCEQRWLKFWRDTRMLGQKNRCTKLEGNVIIFLFNYVIKLYLGNRLICW